MTRRKGYNSFASIPRRLLADLNAGRKHPVTLAEWLAIDEARLLRAVIGDLAMDARGFAGRRKRLLEQAARLRGRKTLERHRGLGVALRQALDGWPGRGGIFRRIATHPSPVVRSWAAYALLADGKLSLASRLKEAKRFAADEDPSVRECAWATFRPHLAADLERGLKLLEPWTRNRDPNIRRCAVEATRPRGVWTEHLVALKEDPSPGLPLLEPVRSDPSKYVRLSVGNWLNDAGKSRPDWLRKVARRWLRESRAAETRWIVRHGTRTLRKAGEEF